MIRIALGLAVLALITSCTSATRPVDSGATVEVDGFQFSPAVVEVPVGSTIVWRNADDVLHTATSGIAAKVDDLGTYQRSKDGGFDGTMDGSGTSFRATFDQPGRYPYFCDRHPHMTGTVVVTATSRADSDGAHGAHEGQ